MATFALVHGGGLGGWCWDAVAQELVELGHVCIAPDRPAEDPAAGAAEYARVVVDALGDSEDVVVVGHSLGGLTIPVVAAMRQVAGLVFLGAMVPEPGSSYQDYLAGERAVLTARTSDSDYDRPGMRGVRPWESALEAYFHDCPLPLARAAWGRIRPQSSTPLTEGCPLTAWPAVPARYILMREDHSVSPDWSRRIARERLGTTALELPGGHSPFLSRPAELAVALDGIATEFSSALLTGQ